MKIARIIPILKTGGAQKFSNYRPVSVSPQFSKTLKKIFHSRLMSFLNDKEILYDGFRKNHSTCTNGDIRTCGRNDNSYR